MWVPVICDICSFILQWCRSSNRGKLWFSCGCALARNAQPQLQNAHLPAQSVCCQMGAVTKNVLQPVCELLLHVLLLVSNRESQSFNIQRAEVKTSVRNKVSTVGTIYNFHTIFFLFFSLFIHSWWMMLPPNVGPCSGSRVSQKAFCCTYAITVMYIVSYHTTPQLCFGCTSCAKNTVWEI